MKVVMIGAYPLQPGVINGGIESVTSTLVHALAARDDIESVTVLRFHHGEAPTDYRREGPKVEVHYLRGQDRWRTITRSFLDARAARKLVAQIQPDVVHGQEIGWFGDIAIRCSPRSVVTVHGLSHIEIRLAARNSLRDRLRVKPIDWMVQRVLDRARVVISISGYDKEQLGGMIRGTRVNIPNPVGAEFFSLTPFRPTEPRLLFAGVLTARKNAVGLVNAFARAQLVMPSARLVMVGPQPDVALSQEIREKVAALGLTESVDFVGLVDNERLRDEIASARAVVLFSLEETAPTIIAQAMAAGKPVVATRVGGVAEMVRDGETGFLVDSKDEVAFADRLVTLCEDQDLCLQMGRRARELALERFEPEAVAQRTVDAYRIAMGSSNTQTLEHNLEDGRRGRVR